MNSSFARFNGLVFLTAVTLTLPPLPASAQPSPSASARQALSYDARAASLAMIPVRPGENLIAVSIGSTGMIHPAGPGGD